MSLPAWSHSPFGGLSPGGGSLSRGVFLQGKGRLCPVGVSLQREAHMDRQTPVKKYLPLRSVIIHEVRNTISGHRIFEPQIITQIKQSIYIDLF